MMGAGTLGVPRRHWDITFSDALLHYDYPPAAYLMLALNGLSAIAAALGGALYIVNVVASVFFGKSTAGTTAASRPATPPPAAVVGSYGSAAEVRIPGTVVLLSVFFVAFVLYYFVNWKYLAEVWPMR